MQGQKITLGSTTYTIVDRLGHGAFGVVYLAEDEDKYPVAIKKIPQIDWNRNEMISLYLLDHPGILKLFDYHHQNHDYYLILDYIPDGDLFTYIQEFGYLTENVARKYFRQIILGLRTAHQRGIYHGDLRLENIFIDIGQDQVIIGDWGLSSFRQYYKTKLLSYNSYCAAYRPPEYFTKKYISMPMLDVWMLGVMIYCAVIGRMPFYGDEVIHQITACRISVPKKISPDLRDLFYQIFQPESRRIELLTMLYHPWFECERMSLDAILERPLPIIPK